MSTGNPNRPYGLRMSLGSTKLNTAHLLETRANMVAHGPDHFAIGSWFKKHTSHTPGKPFGLPSYRFIDLNECGTTACLAGHALLVSQQHPIHPRPEEGEIASWLGIHTWVFWADRWPSWAQYRLADHGSYRACLDLIDALVAYGECPGNPDDLPSPVRA